MSQHDALLACYHSGQMTKRQLQTHMRDDPAFANYVRKKIKQ